MKHPTTGRGKKNDRYTEDNFEDLLVFGYSCKLYRDDEKAQMINEGGLLIPWMGNASLMIDRYDGRGHLYDLDSVNDNSSVSEPLSPQLVAEEELCQEERYRDLNYEQEELLEEELKRQAQAEKGNQMFSFNYGSNEQTGKDKTDDHVDSGNANASENCENVDPDFIAPPELEIPPEMETPKTMKMHALIARTALFVSQNGLQLEIVLKAKQANNAQFEFLYFDKPLNNYYKHVLKMIKNGTYEYKPPKPDKVDAPNKSDDQQDNPDLDKGSSDGDSDYELHPALRPQKTDIEDKIKVQSSDIDGGKIETGSEVIDDGLQKPVPWSSNTNITATTSQSLNLPGRKAQNTSRSDSQIAFGDNTNIPVIQHESNSTSNVVDAMQGIVPPPPDVQGVIDKMAQYVARNGDKFELVVRAKSDPRFNFLLPWNIHYRYYLYKKKLCLQQMAEAAAKVKGNEKSSTKELSEKNASVALVPYTEPVSFTIKAKDTKRVLSEAANDVNNSETVHNDQSKNSLPPLEEPKLGHSIGKVTDLSVADKVKGESTDDNSDLSKQKERRKKAALFVSLLKNKDKRKDNPGDSDIINDTDSAMTKDNATRAQEQTKPKEDQPFLSNIITLHKSPTPENNSPERLSDRKRDYEDESRSSSRKHHKHGHHHRSHHSHHSRQHHHHKKKKRKKNHSKSPFSDSKADNRKRPRYSSPDSDDEYDGSRSKNPVKSHQVSVADSKVDLNKDRRDGNKDSNNEDISTAVEKLPGAPPKESIQVAENLLATLKATLSRR